MLDATLYASVGKREIFTGEGEQALRKTLAIGDRVRHVKSHMAGEVISISQCEGEIVVGVRFDRYESLTSTCSPADLIAIREADQTGGWRLEE